MIKQLREGFGRFGMGIDGSLRLSLCMLVVVFLWGCKTIPEPGEESSDSRSPYPKTSLAHPESRFAEAKLVLMPLDDVDSRALGRLASYLEVTHGFAVSTFTAMGTDETMFDASHRQYITEEIAGNALRVMARQNLNMCDKTVIVLTNRDINSAEFRLRYVLSSHFHRQCISVISAARINPTNFLQPPDEDLVTMRLVKLINKAIGLHLYKFSVSSDRDSVMYGPIMSPMDLDGVRNWYGSENSAGFMARNVPARSQQEGFGAAVVLTANPDKLLENWETVSPVVDLPSSRKVPRQVPLEAFLLFWGCTEDNAGNCQLEMDARVIRPDGSLEGEYKAMEVWKDKPSPGPGYLGLAVGRVGNVATENDPLGVYFIQYTVRDLLSKVEFVVGDTFEVVQ